ncbi:hypothetical protein [Flavobacterium branchiicola]|uniref:Beta-lactamase-inhibitor-like PepSY-like domain-containing protein n=1 Tax=Flavobacterium branchiicola TaxID=1114875 RepID=A0ABV9PKC8_9FLAO|nr:hypothetical protein [Flavobacterium branchiicola]MBS7256586.1 hypothetical protein [Flavobacterium branchiicola]
MKNVLLFGAFLYCSLTMCQNGVLVPPDNVIMAFEKQYPNNKQRTWTIEYGTDDETRFEAKFKTAAKTTGYALYDQYGVFKSYKEQVTNTKLPKNAQLYLDSNFSVKTKSKRKSKIIAKPIARETFSVIDAKNKLLYEVGVKKEGKNYHLFFDEQGNYIRTVQIK